MAKSKNSPKNGGYTPRGSGLSKTFMKDMKSYSFLIEYANNEANGLDVQLRGEYINIYYKGGNLIKLSGRKSYVFDENYFYLPKKGDLCMTDIDRLCHPDFMIKKGESKALMMLQEGELLAKRDQAIEIKNRITRQRDEIVDRLRNCDSLESVGAVVEEMKETMDKWYAQLVNIGKRKEEVGERTIQHYISLQNKKFDEMTDFVVLDIEYAISANAPYANEEDRDKQPRIDILAIEKATGQIFVMELKYGMKSVDGEASTKKHYDDFCKTVGDDNKWKSFLKDIEILLKVKQDYGIIRQDIKIKDCKPQFAFIMKKEAETDEEAFMKHMEDEGISDIHTIYLPVGIDCENRACEGYKLSKAFMK